MTPRNTDICSTQGNPTSLYMQWVYELDVIERDFATKGFSKAEAHVIIALAKGSTRPRAEVARETAMDASFLSRVLKRLERREVIRSSISKCDGRAIDLVLTERGRRIAVLLEKAIAQHLESLTKG